MEVKGTIPINKIGGINSPPITRDPGGIQTRDLQNRNLTLYSAKLPDRINCKRVCN